MASNPEFKFRFTGDLRDLQRQLKELGGGLQEAKKQGQDAGRGISTGMSGLQALISEVRDAVRGVQSELARSREATVEFQRTQKAARVAEKAALDDAAQQLVRLRDRQREVTAEVRKRAAEEARAAKLSADNTQAEAQRLDRIAKKRADSIAAFSAATPEQLRTPAERQSALGAEQTRQRDADLRMLEINRRADALEQRLAATRTRGAAASRAAASATSQQAAATRDLNRQIQLAAPQLTDIAVSLASGQSPFLVAIQQGGQLRDVFGGLRPALVGLSRAFLAVINPVTLTVGALAALAVGYTKGADEGLRFARIVELTGGAAGVTADQLSQMASSLDSLEGSTRASASDTLAQIAESGKIAADQFGIVARASEQMRNATGRDVQATIAEFERLADSPADAVVELNAKYNFLNASIVEQIRTLQEQGRQQEAATLAMQAYADAVDQRTPAIRENLGLIERGWRAIKEAAREAGDGLLEIGRQDTGREAFDRQFRIRQSALAAARGGDRNAQGIVAAAEAEMRRLQDAEANAQREASRQRAQRTAVQLSQDLQADAKQYQSAEQKRAQTRIAAINRANAAVEAATLAGDQKAAETAKASRDQIIATLDKQDAEDAQRRADAATRAAEVAARKSQEARRQAAALVQIDAQLVTDATTRALAELDRLYSEGQVKAADYFAQRSALDLQAIDAEIKAAEAQRDVAVELDERKRAEAEIIRLTRDRAEVGVRAAREQAAAERELNQELERLRARLADATGAIGEQERVRLEQERDQLLQRLGSDPRAKELVESIFDAELARSRADAIMAQRDRIVGNLQTETQFLGAQSELGAISPLDAEAQLQAARQRSIEQLQKLRDAAAAAYGEKPPPEVFEALRQLDIEIAQVQISQNQLANSIKDQAVSSLTGFFDQLATGAASFEEAFKGMVRSFAAGLAKMLAEALAKKAILAILNAFTGGGAGVASAAAGVAHSGAKVGAGFPAYRTVPATTFIGAPRFHNGSGGPIGGLKADEVPAILQTGERVLNRKETMAYEQAQRATGGDGTRVVNVFGENFVPDQMDSAAGERVILNVIGKNPGRVRQILG